MTKKVIAINAGSLKKGMDKLKEAMQEDNDEKLYIITSASLKDSFCNYSYEIASGVTKGDECNRKGSLLVHDDLRNAFKKLHAHLAAICEEIDHNKINDIEQIVDYDEDEHKVTSLEYKVSRFYVDSFSISGNGDKEGVSLSGSKMLSTDELVKLTSPKKTWDCDYPFIMELRAVIDDLITEVEYYMNGKSQPKMVQAELPLAEGTDETNTTE